MFVSVTFLRFIRRVRGAAMDHRKVGPDSPMVGAGTDESWVEQMRIVTVPGIGGSDEAHWQSRWEASWGSQAFRIVPGSWAAPDLTDWSRAISEAVTRAEADVVLVAHSLGCLAVTHWLEEEGDAVAGVVLVAPPDPTGPKFPANAAPTFTSLAINPVRTPGLVMTSDDDPYCDSSGAARLCQGWELPRISLGNHGHLNSTSGLGSWETGRNLLTAFIAGLGQPRGDRARHQ